MFQPPGGPRTILWAVFLLAGATPTALGQEDRPAASRPSLPWESSPRVETTGIRFWVELLDGPEFGGRVAGTAGADAASRRIIERLSGWGLQPAPGAPGFRQEFSLGHLALGTPQRLLAQGKPLVLFEDFVPRPDSGNGTVQGIAVPVGMGVRIPELGVDLLAGKDLKGKIALIDRDGWADLMTRYRALSPEVRSQVRERIFQRGALLADLAELGAIGAISFRRPLPARSSGSGRLPPGAAGETGRLGFLQGIQVSRKREALIPALEVTQEVGLSLAGKKIEFEVNLDYQTRKTANILALLPGTEPGAPVLVLATHLDGRAEAERAGWSPAPRQPAGNAAGLAVLLEAARVLSLKKERPARPILIAFFSARHVSLAGSRHYMASPSFPPSTTLAMINLENPERVLQAEDLPLIASIPPESAGLSFQILKAATRNGLPLSIEGDRPAFNGDHWPFFDQQIPVAHFHRPAAPGGAAPKTSQSKIDFRRLEQGARALVELAESLAASPRGEVRWLKERR